MFAKVGLNLISGEISKKLNREITKFQIVFTKSDNILKFNIPDERGYNETYLYDDKESKISSLIEFQIKQHLNKKCDIDAFEISFSKGDKKRKIKSSARAMILYCTENEKGEIKKEYTVIEL